MCSRPLPDWRISCPNLSPSLFPFSVLGLGPTLPINGPCLGYFRSMTRWFPYQMADLTTFVVGLQPLALYEHTFSLFLVSSPGLPKVCHTGARFCQGPRVFSRCGSYRSTSIRLGPSAGLAGEIAKPAFLFHLPKDGIHDDFQFCIEGMTPFRPQRLPYLVGHGQVLRGSALGQ